jgi:hypothetical protein
MANLSKLQIVELSSSVNDLRFVPPTSVGAGGVDPLGLRQINFDMMDQVFPGLNNVARHIRPFVVVSWAWRRAIQIAGWSELDKIKIETLRDYVDRIEIIYTWSQILQDPNADLPGRQVLAEIVRSDNWAFGGAAWEARKKTRRDSTAFTAAINYGPALKSMGWVTANPRWRDVLLPNQEIYPALDEFEREIQGRLEHPAFSQFGTVNVTRSEVLSWGDGWTLGEATTAERQVTASLLVGASSPDARRKGMALAQAAVEYSSSRNVRSIRQLMAGVEPGFVPPAGLEDIALKWRRVQVRQLFRFALEALLFWISQRLRDSSPQLTSALIDAVIYEAPTRSEAGVAKDWLDRRDSSEADPVSLIEKIEFALKDPALSHLISAIFDAISFCLLEAPDVGEPFERSDRLPLYRARREADAYSHAAPRELIQQIIESWVLAQHAYWAVGRGLADARARGKTILRLRVVLDEGGWTLVPNASTPAPIPTADRLQTAISLAGECGLF